MSLYNSVTVGVILLPCATRSSTNFLKRPGSRNWYVDGPCRFAFTGERGKEKRERKLERTESSVNRAHNPIRQLPLTLFLFRALRGSSDSRSREGMTKARERSRPKCMCVSAFEKRRVVAARVTIKKRVDSKAEAAGPQK